MSTKFNLSAEIIAVSRKSEKAVSKQLSDMGVVFDKALSLNEKRELLIKKLLEKDVVDAVKQELTDKDRLEKTAAKMLEDANAHNEVLKGLESQEEIDAYIESIEDEFGVGVREELEKVFPKIRQTRAAIPTANDLPASDIITTLSVRVVEQAIAKVIANYPMMSNVSTEMVRNGLKEIFYQDYTDADSESGFSDVKIGDFNGERPLEFSELIQVDTEIHKSYKILSTMLNDVTVTPGLFVALVNSFTYAIARPIAKKMFERFVAYLEDDTNFDFVKAFASADTTERAKELSNKLTSLNTTSRKHLSQKPDGSSKILEVRVPATEINLILNSKFSTDYNYDLAAKTFQLGKVTYTVKSIEVVDFELVKDYTSDPSTSKFADTEVIMLQDGKYTRLVHYDAAKTIDTPKMFKTYHSYTRVGALARKDKFAGKFKKHA